MSDGVLPTIEPVYVIIVLGDDKDGFHLLLVGADDQPLPNLPRRGAVQTTPSKKPH